MLIIRNSLTAPRAAPDAAQQRSKPGTMVRGRPSVAASTVSILALVFASILMLAFPVIESAEAQIEQRNTARGEAHMLVNSSPSQSLASSLAGDDDAVARNFLGTYGARLGLRGAFSEVTPLRTDVDALGVWHRRFRQSGPFGIPVCGAEVITHGIGPVVQIANGRMLDTSEAPAALWEGSEGEIRSRVQHLIAERSAEHPLAIEIVSLELCYFNQRFFTGRAGDRDQTLLSYHVVYRHQRGQITQALFMEAQDPWSILHEYSLTPHQVQRVVYDCSPGDNCYVDQADPFYTDYILGRSEGQPARGGNPRFNGVADTDAAYDDVGFSHDYFAQIHGRNGANLSGGLGDGVYEPTTISAVLVFLDAIAPSTCPNAFWNGIRLNFCRQMATTDIVGHEYAHAVTQYAANLVYQNESGALNESYSDVFGEAIERFKNGSNDWKLGVGSIIGVLRDMSDPASLSTDFGSYPDRFNADTFYCGEQDSGGVHFNSSVPNYAAYLLAAGGTFNGCTIQAIGNEKMERIFYRALTVYLTQTSGFNQAYQALVQSCSDLGYTSDECLQVTRALQAVEMDQPGRCSGTAPATPQCSSAVPAPTPTSAPAPDVTPTPSAPQLTALTLGGFLKRKGKSATRYALVGQTLDATGAALAAVPVRISCSSKGKESSLDTHSDEEGLFGASVTVRKNARVLCAASSGALSSSSVRLSYRRPNKF